MEALEALDGWWNVPWPTQWQRSYYRDRDHAVVHGPPDAAVGLRLLWRDAADGRMRDTAGVGRWMYLEEDRNADETAAFEARYGSPGVADEVTGLVRVRPSKHDGSHSDGDTLGRYAAAIGAAAAIDSPPRSAALSSTGTATPHGHSRRTADPWGR
ncbi:DUF6584 family protein [Streptomyces sp. NPDC052016]|uniref:DUF6584 family protein n=1 Tax=Streptomyces sp. NPDC052016 TaxID=3365680 RepID=UPI0037CDD5F4